MAEEYKEYETARLIADIWHDSNAVGLCSLCGMDDCPIFKNWTGVKKCKWCAEKDNITYHLTNKSTNKVVDKADVVDSIWFWVCILAPTLVVIVVLFIGIN